MSNRLKWIVLFFLLGVSGCVVNKRSGFLYTSFESEDKLFSLAQNRLASSNIEEFPPSYKKKGYVLFKITNMAKFEDYTYPVSLEGIREGLRPLLTDLLASSKGGIFEQIEFVQSRKDIQDNKRGFLITVEISRPYVKLVEDSWFDGFISFSFGYFMLGLFPDEVYIFGCDDLKFTLEDIAADNSSFQLSSQKLSPEDNKTAPFGINLWDRTGYSILLALVLPQTFISPVFAIPPAGDEIGSALSPLFFLPIFHQKFVPLLEKISFQGNYTLERGNGQDIEIISGSKELEIKLKRGHFIKKVLWKDEPVFDYLRGIDVESFVEIIKERTGVFELQLNIYKKLKDLHKEFANPGLIKVELRESGRVIEVVEKTLIHNFSTSLKTGKIYNLLCTLKQGEESETISFSVEILRSITCTSEGRYVLKYQKDGKTTSVSLKVRFLAAKNQ